MIRCVAFSSLHVTTYYSYRRTANLLTGETELTQEELEKADSVKYEILSHWHPNLTLNIVEDYTAWTRGCDKLRIGQYVIMSYRCNTRAYQRVCRLQRSRHDVSSDVLLQRLLESCQRDDATE